MTTNEIQINMKQYTNDWKWFRYLNVLIVACDSGRYGCNCSESCPDNTYGPGCYTTCDCPEGVSCDPIVGCGNGTHTSQEDRYNYSAQQTILKAQDDIKDTTRQGSNNIIIWTNIPQNYFNLLIQHFKMEVCASSFKYTSFLTTWSLFCCNFSAHFF